jgi:hypothetical protein
MTEKPTMSDMNKLREALEKMSRCLLPVTMGLAEAELIGEPPADDAVVLSFMGSGASDRVTVKDINDAFASAREALSVPEEAPQSKPERSEEFEDLLVAAEAHLAVHPCTPKPCQPELSLKAALDAFGVRQMPATVKCPKCGNLRLRAGGACGPCSESWFARYGSDADAKLVREQFARPRLFCTKCGYHGPEQRHPGCGYIAMSLDGEPEVVGRPVPEEAGPERIGRRTEYEWGEAIGSPGGSEGFGGDGDALIAAAFRSPVPEPARMSREEAEIRGAEAILRNDGFDPKLHPPMGSERGGMALMRARAVLTALGFPGEDGKR